MKNRRTIVSLWLIIAILLLAALFLAFVFIEYQRNTALVEQNRHLIADSAKGRLTYNLLDNQGSQNWAKAESDYRWIQHPPKDYWFNDAKQEFPWHRLDAEMPSKKSDDWSRVWSAVDSLSDSALVNAQRLALLVKMEAALASNDQSIIRQSFDAYVEHKNAFLLSPVEEVAFSLKLVEIGAKDHWSPELVNAILVTGGPAKMPIFRPVIDFLFRHNALFTNDEFELIIDKVQQQLEALNLSDFYLEQYLTHMLEPQFVPPKNKQLSNIASETLIDGQWLLRHVSNNFTRVEPIDLNESMKYVEQEFMQLSVLNEGDSIALSELPAQLPLSKVVINVNKQQLTQDKIHQTWYLVIKSTMLIMFLALVLLSLRLIEKNQQRKLEYIALKEDFVKLVSHELKTPLAGIRAMAETLRKRIERGLDVQSYPERIVSEADKLWYMVDNILGFNRVQTRQVVISKQAIKLKTLCNDIADDAQTFSNTPYVITNIIDEAAEENVDIELFSLVLKNIIVNAGLYNERPSINIQVAYDPAKRCLTISDNGIGISEADRPKVFMPFVRLSQSARQSGTGLGLALCKQIMQLHDGDLALATSSSNGSVWKISFTR